MNDFLRNPHFSSMPLLGLCSQYPSVHSLSSSCLDLCRIPVLPLKSDDKVVSIKKLVSMAIRVVEFSNREYRIRKIFAQESTYPKEIIEF